MNLDQTLGSLDPGFDWGWSRQPVFPADNSGLGGGGRIAKSLMRTQRFNRLDQKERESVEESALVTRHFTLS
jgi:hypothetical protein